MRNITEQLEQIRRHDPEFSVVLFEDFVFRLYAQAHEASARPGDLDALSPYLSPSVREHLGRRTPLHASVANVVIGAMRFTEVCAPQAAARTGEQPGTISITVEFESNMSVTSPERAETCFVIERWSFQRAANVTTRPPAAARDFPCPNCGGPFTSSDRQRCDYCGEVVDNGRFDWTVTGIQLVSEARHPPTLTGTVAEHTNPLTTVDPQVYQQWEALTRADPALDTDQLQGRLTLIFTELNRAWCALDLTAARPYCSDGLFAYLRYWIDAYQQQGLRNVVDEARLESWVLAKLVRDRHYDALTVRIWATGRDYTVDVATGRVVGGDRDRDRPYSEYWTLIRGASTRGAARADKRCPGCGAELQITMAGSCAHCEVHVTSGEFDWVLSKIEQDDAYRG